MTTSIGPKHKAGLITFQHAGHAHEAALSMEDLWAKNDIKMGGVVGKMDLQERGEDKKG